MVIYVMKEIRFVICRLFIGRGYVLFLCLICRLELICFLLVVIIKEI